MGHQDESAPAAPGAAGTAPGRPAAAHQAGRCHCEDCRRQHAAWRARREHLAAAGRWHPWADPAPARARVLELIGAGMPVRQIAAAASVSRALVAGLRDGRPDKIRAENAAALLAVSPGPATEHARVPATGATRKVRALMVNGWRGTDQADRSGLSPATIAALATGQPVTTAAVCRAVSALYDELWDRPGPSDRTRKHALAQAWAPAMAWDDDTIDDPAAVPQGVRADQPSGFGRATEVIQDSEELIRRGMTLAQAAELLEVGAAALQQARIRHGIYQQAGKGAA